MGFIALLVLPAILMAVCILVIPDLLPILDSLMHLRVIVLVVLFLLIGMFLVMPTYDRDNVIIGIQVFGPIPLAGAIGFLLQYSLRKLNQINWSSLAVSLGFLVAGCFLLWQTASHGRLGPVLAFLIALSAAGTVLVSAIWMAWSLQRWRKLTGLLIGFTVPAVFLASVWLGNSRSPEEITQRHGDMIVQALEQHYADTAEYPTNLAELVPSQLNELPEALTTQGTGWLYTSDTHEFTLGYWHYPDKYGVILCLHSSESSGWQCESTFMRPEGWSPFSPVPTPTLRP